MATKEFFIGDVVRIKDKCPNYGGMKGLIMSKKWLDTNDRFYEIYFEGATKVRKSEVNPESFDETAVFAPFFAEDMDIIEKG